MTDHGIVILGIPIASSAPLFLAVVAAHVVVGLVCVVAGLVAMMSPKRHRRHPAAGTIYFWSLAVVFASMSMLSAMRWSDDSHLFLVGLLSFTAACVGRAARRVRWPGWLRHHMIGMGLSYILLLTAFYVDNGANLPFWQTLPPLVYWIAPSLVGLPILIFVLLRHPLVLQQRRANS